MQIEAPWRLAPRWRASSRCSASPSDRATAGSGRDRANAHDELENAEETRFPPGASGEWGYAQEQILSWPYYRLGMSSMSSMGTDVMGMGNMNAGPQVVARDRVPAGDIEVRRGEHVHATDGSIGRV